MTILPYQDAKLTSEERAADVLKRMTLEEKAGQMFHQQIAAVDLSKVNEFFPGLTGQEMLDRGIRHFNLFGNFKTPREQVEWVNNLQKVALSTGVGIPVTLSTDPTHCFSDNPSLSMPSDIFSRWPEQIGMVAIASPEEMLKFCDIVRQEYCAVGIRAALHPQVDLSTEYRWSRIAGGLGEDNKLAAQLAAAHVLGLQGPTIGPESVNACIKHFPGGAPARDGLDCHFWYGSDAIYPGDNFEYHLEPFKAAINSRLLMPSYGRPMGTKYDEVSMGFNKGIITGLLKEELGYKGTVVSDWMLLHDKSDEVIAKVGEVGKRKAYGEGFAEKTPEELLVMSLDAGVDQFGGEECPELIVKVVKEGLVPESRIDLSVHKLLVDKFDLGIFDKPFLDIEHAEKVVGCPEFVAAGNKAQKDSCTLLKNEGKLLPLAKGTKVYIEGGKENLSSDLVTVVSTPQEADVIVNRTSTAHVPRGTGWIEQMFHHGDLEFSTEFLAHITELSKIKPVIVTIGADRPPVLGSIDDDATAIILTYGTTDTNLFELLFGDGSPKGKLPFDLPRSSAAVKASRADVPFDTEDPTYKWGFGLTY